MREEHQGLVPAPLMVTPAASPPRLHCAARPVKGILGGGGWCPEVTTSGQRRRFQPQPWHLKTCFSMWHMHQESFYSPVAPLALGGFMEVTLPSGGPTSPTSTMFRAIEEIIPCVEVPFVRMSASG